MGGQEDSLDKVHSFFLFFYGGFSKMSCSCMYDGTTKTWAGLPTPTWQLTRVCVSSSRGSGTLWPLQALYRCDALTNMQANIHTHKVEIKSFLKER